jgi:predicted PurR-regulated permease PerM
MPTAASTNRALIILATGALVVAALWFGRPVLAPLAVALLLVFLLAPAIEWLQRHGLRGPAAMVLVCITFMAGVAAVGVLVVVQGQSLLEQLPQYRSNIRNRVAEIQHARAGTLSEDAQHTLSELGSALEPDASTDATRVTVVEPHALSDQLAPVMPLLASGGLAIMLAFFILLGRRAMRDRIVHLFGRRNLTLTTRALDEAGERISRYLLLQGLLNAGFGLVIAIGLYAIGVQFALLWGLLGALLRFIPYVGSWIAGAMPALLSLATTTGWTQPLEVVGLYAVAEITLGMFIEPVVYGRAAGLSPVALVLAIAFWTLLWGPVGLFVATPLSVCLYVLCRHVPQLAPIAFLLGNEPVANDDAKYYQRLLAHDEDEALQIASEYAREHGPEQACDEVLLAALSSLKEDRARGGIDDDDVRFGVRATGRIAEALDGATPEPGPGERPLVLGCPASDELDAIALGMLQHLVQHGGQCDMELLGSELLISEVLAHVARTQPGLICIGSLSPGGIARTQLLCRRLRAQSPQVRIVVGRWHTDELEADAGLLREAGADRVGTTLLESQRDVLALSVLQPPTEPARHVATALASKEAPARG